MTSIRWQNRFFEFFVGKAERMITEIDYIVFRARWLSVFLTKSLFAQNEKKTRPRIVIWLGPNNEFTKQIFIY